MMIGRGYDAVLYYGEIDDENQEDKQIKLIGNLNNCMGIATDTKENMKITDGIVHGITQLSKDMTLFKNMEIKLDFKNYDARTFYKAMTNGMDINFEHLRKLHLYNNYRKMHNVPMLRRGRK